MRQTEVNEGNSRFWDELCGTTTARQLGINDRSETSIAAFDEWFFRYYPYLCSYLPLDVAAGKDLVEIGLGYGSVGSRLMRAGASYTAVDIAGGPVEMMKYRSRLLGLQATFLQESFLETSLPAESQDFVVSIGCFHHTGDVQRCIDNAHRLLRIDGTLIFMVYHRYGYKQWFRWPLRTARNWLFEHGFIASPSSVTEEQRSRYDENIEGAAAPQTEFFSCRELREMLKGYSSVSIHKENVDDAPWPFRLLLRRRLLLPWFGRLFGRDLYVVAKK